MGGSALKMLFVLYFVVIIGLVAGKNEEYKGHRIYKVELETQDQQDKLSLLKSDHIDFLRKPSFTYGMSGLAIVPPSEFNWFEEQLADLGIARDIYAEDVYEYLFEKSENAVKRELSSAEDEGEFIFDIRGYHRYNDILYHLRDLAEQYTSPTARVELVEYGVTFENRTLVYLRLSSTNPAGGSPGEKPVIVVEGGINPREWITIPAALYAVESLLAEQRLLDNADWIVFPVVNPDGYEFTHLSSRLWQKSRSTSSHLGSICPGVNINRNFDLDWQNFDGSSSPCSHVYAGIEPFSEVEAQMVGSIIREYGSRIKLYISLQNNGGFVSYPWSYERAASGMFRQHHLLGLDMISVMNEEYNTDVASRIFDRASGTSSDYAKEHDILYTFNIDVAHRNNDVIIPESEIGNIVEDVWRAITVAANEMFRLYN